MEEDEAFTPTPGLMAKMEEARRRIQAAMESDPAFAERIRQPLSEDVPMDEVLEAAYSRRFADEVFIERYGRELLEPLR